MEVITFKNVSLLEVIWNKSETSGHLADGKKKKGTYNFKYLALL